MNRIVITLFALCMFFGMSTPAYADDQPRHRTFGMAFDVGVPDGAALGVVVRPYFNWLRLEAAGTYNGLAPGVRGGLTLDPINFPVAPTLTAEGGHAWEGNVPKMTNPIGVEYNYANFHLGLEFGRRNYWRIFLRGGMSYLDLQTSGFQNAINVGDGVTLGNPTFTGWVPSGKIGVMVLF